ncbi:MAG: riboflavin synthase [Planctomycetes bacterium]|nr:riboflavin synthase [Planctomycetota bacterium]
MFTGLIEGLGQVAAIEAETAGIRLVIAPPAPMLGAGPDRCQLGDSVAINGCCLTVIEIKHDCWSFQAGTETLSKTNLGRLVVGNPVNLERSLPVHGRLGGHFVQGHVDGVGSVDRMDREGEWIAMWFRVPEALAQLMVSKGSVAVDGISLTVVHVERERFSVALIPHTLSVTTLGIRQVGDPVNIETDILGKYVQKLLNLPGTSLPPQFDCPR